MQSHNNYTFTIREPTLFCYNGYCNNGNKSLVPTFSGTPTANQSHGWRKPIKSSYLAVQECTDDESHSFTVKRDTWKRTWDIGHAFQTICQQSKVQE